MESDHLLNSTEGGGGGLSRATHISLGVIFSVAGVVGIISNIIVLVSICRSLTKRTCPASVLLVNLIFSDIGILVMGFPINASAHFAGRWMYGKLGCQVYGFCCFVFGTAHIGAMALLAYEQYRIISRMRPDAAPSHSYLERLQKIYTFHCTLIWAFACVWAALPLQGWSRYALEPFGTSCTIDWRHPTREFRVFVVVYFFGGYLFPFSMISYSLHRINRMKRAHRAEYVRRSVSAGPPTIIDKLKKQREEDLSLTCLLIVVLFLMTWTPYAVLCLWSVTFGPERVPLILSIGPNIPAKISGAISPVIYVVSNRTLRAEINITIRTLCGQKTRHMAGSRDSAAKRLDEAIGMPSLTVETRRDNVAY